jgi:hypothetical protein
MAHTHGGDEEGHDHHGGGRGLAWELLDSIMFGCFLVVAGLLGEQLYKSWRASRVRYDLTPAGLAATDTPTGPLVDREALKAELDRLNAEDARRREGEG